MVSRRKALTQGLSLGVSGIAALSAFKLGCSSQTRGRNSMTQSTSQSASSSRVPTLYLPHGGGPWPFVELGFGSERENGALREYLTSIASVPSPAPRAVLVISAHWEERNPTLMTAARPPMLYDYYGFPEAAYHIEWPAPGAPDLVDRVDGLLRTGGFSPEHNASRGFDHGTFVPLKLAYPNPNVPVLQLSLKTGLDPAEHIAIGRALAPLRDEGVFIVGSGSSFHNMRGFGNPNAAPISQEFDNWLRDTTLQDASTRNNRLAEWEHAPGARFCHPREEHLLPLMVCAGAALDDAGGVPYHDTYTGVAMSAHQFG